MACQKMRTGLSDSLYVNAWWCREGGARRAGARNDQHADAEQQREHEVVGVGRLPGGRKGLCNTCGGTSQARQQPPRRCRASLPVAICSRTRCLQTNRYADTSHLPGTRRARWRRRRRTPLAQSKQTHGPPAPAPRQGQNVRRMTFCASCAAGRCCACAAPPHRAVHCAPGLCAPAGQRCQGPYATAAHVAVGMVKY